MGVLAVMMVCMCLVFVPTVVRAQTGAALTTSLQGGVAERFRKYREASAYREAGVVFR